MRDLKASKNNLITIHDHLSNTKIGIYYSTLKSSDRISYQSEMLKILRDAPEKEHLKLIKDHLLDFTLNIITGFTDGSFSIDGKEISSDPASENYYPDWKLFLKENASEILESVNSLLFNSPNTLQNNRF